MKQKVDYSLRLAIRNKKWYVLSLERETFRNPFATRAKALSYMGFSKDRRDSDIESRVPPKRWNPRVKARKYGGDDYASWAVFIDGRPFVTGLTLNEVPHYREVAEARLK